MELDRLLVPCDCLVHVAQLLFIQARDALREGQLLGLVVTRFRQRFEGLDQRLQPLAGLIVAGELAEDQRVPWMEAPRLLEDPDGFVSIAEVLRVNTRSPVE